MKTLLAATLILVSTLVRAEEKNPDYPQAKETYSHVLKVRDFFGAEGYTYEYLLDKETLVIVLSDDFGSPRKEVLSKPLTKEEAAAWERYLKNFPVKELKETYEDPRVRDGMQRYFTFKTGDGEKQVTVRNVQVKELSELCKKLNQLLPEKFKLGGGGSAVVGPADK